MIRIPFLEDEESRLHESWFAKKARKGVDGVAPRAMPKHNARKRHAENGAFGAG